MILYETLLILGGTAGNLMDLFHLPLAGAGTAFLALWGLALGVFVGCLVMSLAETLKALPVLGRRLGLAVGIQYLILSIAAGKFVGAMVYFPEDLEVTDGRSRKKNTERTSRRSPRSTAL